MAYKSVLILLVLGVAIFSGCVSNPENSVVGTYVWTGNPNGYFTLYANSTCFLHDSDNSTWTGYYAYSSDNRMLCFKNYYPDGNDDCWTQKYGSDNTFINNLGGVYVKK
jgi:hypothetical protein